MGKIIRMILVACVGTALGTATATTYYVDFADGNNNADGGSAATPWKHSPGDANASGNPANVQLAGGDRIVFKGGVAYHGSIALSVSGTPGQPIVFDGNAAGGFGQGKAILDGGRVIEGWLRVASAEDAGGNPRWAEIFYADVEVDIRSNAMHGAFVLHRQAPTDQQAPWQRVILSDGDEGLLPIAQMPKPSDAFYPDLPRDFYRSATRLSVEENRSVITDTANLTAGEADYYDGMFVGVHGGNNHVYFAPAGSYDPQSSQLVTPRFGHRLYDETRYAFYNSVKLISQPGEWAIESLADGRSRVYLLPTQLVGGQPANIGFPVYKVGIAIDQGASHVRVSGFLIQRYSGGSGGISVARISSARSKDIGISNCEIRFVAGHAGIGLNYCDDIVVENNKIYQCPGWTTAIFLNRVNNFHVTNNRLVKNSGSGIRHYECKDGLLKGNYILDHFGMHSSAINVYEGCANLLLEDNYIQNTATVNRNADTIVFRNNVIDGMGRTAVAMAMWNSGRVGGRDLKNIQFLNNTFVNVNQRSSYGAGIFGQTAGNPSPPQGLVIRNNILDRVGGALQGVIENNIFTRDLDERLKGQDGLVITDLNILFIDPVNGDFRRRPGGPNMDIGANIAPPKPIE